MQKYMLRQTSRNTCGNAVAKMFLAIESKNLRALLLKDDETLDNFLKIKKFLNEHHLIVEGRRVTHINDLDKTRKVMIVQIKKDNKLHFVLIKRKNKRYYEINDPGYGNYILSKETFASVFTGFYLINVKKCHYKRISGQLIHIPFKKRTLTGFLLFYVFSVILLSLALVAFDQIDYLPYAVTMAAFSFITYIMSRQYLFKMSRNYDRALIVPISKCTNEDFMRTYEESHLIKRDILESLTKLVSASLITILLITLLLINDIKMLLPLLYVFVSLIIEKRISKKKQFEYLCFDEALHRIAKLDVDKTEALNHLNDRSSSFISSYFFKSIIFDTLTLFFILLIMLINEILSLNYILLYFFLFQFLRNNLKVLVNTDSLYSTLVSRINQLDTISKIK